jgi:hypothetical protein
MKLHAGKGFSVTQGQSFLFDQTCHDSGKRLGCLLPVASCLLLSVSPPFVADPKKGSENPVQANVPEREKGEARSQAAEAEGVNLPRSSKKRCVERQDSC